MPRPRLPACSTQPVEQVTSPRASPPRRTLRSRQGNAGVVINLGEGGTSFIMAQGTTSEYRIKKCNDKRCQTCRNLILSKNVTSNVTGRSYEAINYTTSVLSGHSQNTIYLCTCLKCNIQYVGETVQPLNERINGHRTSKEGCEHEIYHRDEVCGGYNFKFQILEKLPGNGYLPSGEVDPEMLTVRKAHEDIWIKKLRTIYPYGLNEKATDKVTDSKVNEPAVGRLFPPLPRHSGRPIRSRENRNDKTSILSCADFFSTVTNLISDDLQNSFNEIRKLLNVVKKPVLKEIAFHIMERDMFTFIDERSQWYDYILDIIETKLLKVQPEPKRKPFPKNVVTIKFVNKGMDDIHLNKIFRSKEVLDLMPSALNTEEDIPMVTMKLTPPVRSKILNYRETVSSLDVVVDEDVSYVRNLPSCECHTSEFKDPHHNHVITGDLRVVQNPKLRKLLTKGPNYREPNTLNYSSCKSEIKSSLTSAIDKITMQYNISIESLLPWKNKILQLVDQRIKIMKTKKTPSITKTVLEDEDVKSALDDLHSKFVVVPIDKASNNVAIICKRYYIQTLLEEVGVPGDTSPTYKMSDRDTQDVIADNSILCERFGLSLEDRMQTLPFMYWLPKMHYSPPRCRFIVASSSCSTKPLSKLASTIYKHIFNQVRTFHSKSSFYKNYNRFWVIENSFPVIEKLSKLNEKKKARNVSTYDFSTLYTKLPHDELIKNLDEVVDFVFKGGKKKVDGNRKYLTVRGSYAYWTKKKHGTDSFTRAQIKLLTSHLIKETYFQVGNLLFKQCIGIPMGIDPAPFWANLHLYTYEDAFIFRLIKSDKGRAIKFRHSTRFIDDECNLNDNGEFGKSYREIYPNNLELKCEHEGSHATFLDLDITILDGCFIYKLFDKRDNFPFFIVRMPDLSGNIPSYVFYGSVMSEFLRIARSTLLYRDFLPVAVNLYKRMLNQGGTEAALLNQIKRALNRHPSAFKFRKSASQIVEDISTG